MRILLCNKFHYARGGDCVYVHNVRELLRSHGHETAVFSMRHPENMRTEWEKYFPSEVRFHAGSGSCRAVGRMLGDRETGKRFNALLDDFRPEVVHLNNVHSYLSPSIGEIAHRRGIRVVWTLHDYKLLCPRYDCMRNGTEPCEECYGDKRGVLRYGCMKDSRIASMLAYAEARTWSRERIESFTDAYICPSRFMAEKMAQGGFSPKKIKVLRNFVHASQCRRDAYDKGDYYCYLGRLSPEKGLRKLIEAANTLPYRLTVIGTGPMSEKLRGMSRPNIEYVGYREWEDIRELVGKARFCVVPSEWYENSPLSVIEALCLGTPVLGARIGGIPELIDEGENGMTFVSGDIGDLRDKIHLMYGTPFDYAGMAREACAQYDADAYYEKLTDIYTSSL